MSDQSQRHGTATSYGRRHPGALFSHQLWTTPSRCAENESVKSVMPSRDESVNPGCPLNESIKHDRQSCRRRPGERTPSGHTYVSITSDPNHLQYVQMVWNTCSRWPTSCARRRPCRAVLFWQVRLHPHDAWSSVARTDIMGSWPPAKKD